MANRRRLVDDRLQLLLVGIKDDLAIPDISGTLFPWCPLSAMMLKGANWWWNSWSPSPGSMVAHMW